MQAVQWAEAARAAARAGRWLEAEDLWRKVLGADARHPEALYSLGVHAFQAGHLEESVDLLRRACEAAPGEATVWVFLSAVLKAAGLAEEAWEAIQGALVADPYSLAALLAKASLLEEANGAASAVVSYRNALKVAPPSQHWPPHLREQLEHASRLVEAETRAYQDYLLQTLDGLIRQELEAALAGAQGAFTPYITYAPGQPVNQWGELNHSDRWSTLDLWKSGSPIAGNQQLCPGTTRALAEVDLAQIEGLCPNVMFSALAPRTRIPPHHGETNARVIAHLPLVVPENCEYRVGFDRIQWKPGEVIVFDDTLEHEAYNGSDVLRTVLIFDVWNPLLSQDDREIVLAMAAAARSYGGG